MLVVISPFTAMTIGHVILTPPNNLAPWLNHASGGIRLVLRSSIVRIYNQYLFSRFCIFLK
jgi:hypothetical protein